MGTLKVYMSSKSNWVGSWMKNPSRIVQYKDTGSCLDHPWAVSFWKLEWERYLPTSLFSDSALPLWFWPLVETVLGWVGIWFDHPGCSEVLTTVCSKILKEIGFLFGSSFLGCFFVYLFFTLGLLQEWHLKCSHYFVLAASKGMEPSWTPLLPSMTGTHQAVLTALFYLM